MKDKVADVFSTYDYDSFKKLQGNRDVFDERKKLIKASIEERGWIRNPIVVNKHMEIIDGQGRFEALRELSMPIEYVIAEDADINDCIALNLKQKNWTSKDFVDCYCKEGNRNYLILNDAIKKYPNLSISVLCVICGSELSESGPTLNKIKSGAFEISDIDNLYERLDFVSCCFDVLGKDYGRRALWAMIFRFVFYAEAINNETFIYKLKKYKGELCSCTRSIEALRICEAIYNKNSKKNKVYFEKEYDDYRRKHYQLYRGAHK